MPLVLCHDRRRLSPLADRSPPIAKDQQRGRLR
jgi:hypothetical protein